MAENDLSQFLSQDDLSQNDLDYDAKFTNGHPEPVEDDIAWPQPGQPAGISVADLVVQLIRGSEMPTLQALSVLSDLSRTDRATVQRDWSLVPVARRRQVISTLIREAEENLDVFLGQILRVALTDEDEEIRSLAIAGLWEDMEPDLVSTFVQMMMNDAETSVRAAAARALGIFVMAGELDELDTSLALRTEDALLSVLQSDVEPVSVQSAALESIAFSGEVGVRQLIEDAYYASMPELRVSSLVAMGRSADLRWRALARAELQNPEAAMRREAARACGELEVKNALRELILLLEDDDLTVRVAAISALGRIGGKDAQDALRVMEESEIPDEAEAATLALEELLFSAAEGIALYEEDDWDDDGDLDIDIWGEEDDDLGEYGD